MNRKKTLVLMPKICNRSVAQGLGKAKLTNSQVLRVDWTIFRL